MARLGNSKMAQGLLLNHADTTAGDKVCKSHTIAAQVCPIADLRMLSRCASPLFSQSVHSSNLRRSIELLFTSFPIYLVRASLFLSICITHSFISFTRPLSFMFFALLIYCTTVLSICLHNDPLTHRPTDRPTNTSLRAGIRHCMSQACTASSHWCTGC